MIVPAAFLFVIFVFVVIVCLAVAMESKGGARVFWFALAVIVSFAVAYFGAVVTFYLYGATS
jgi:hypothetical protein